MSTNDDAKTNALALIKSHDDIKGMAQAAAQSRLFGTNDVQQAYALMLLAHADGIHPMQAMRRYHVIQGRPSMKAEAMLSDFQRTGGKVEWHEHSETRCAATFSHPQGGTMDVEWKIEDARKAGLAAKDNWKNYPKSMLHARVVSDGVRWTFPQAVQGFYTPEELMDGVGQVEAAPAPVVRDSEGNVINVDAPDGRPKASRLKDKLAGSKRVKEEGIIADAEIVGVAIEQPQASDPDQDPEPEPEADRRTTLQNEIKELVLALGKDALKGLIVDLGKCKLSECSDDEVAIIRDSMRLMQSEADGGDEND